MLLRDVTASAGKLESMNVVVFVAKANPYFLEHFECYSGTTDEHIALSNYGLVLVERAIRQVLALAQEWEQSDES